MRVNAKDIEDYLKQIPEDRREAIIKIRTILINNLPEGFHETLSYDMIGFVIPHSLYPAGYHCDTSLPLPFINLANQKNYIALYHMGLMAFEEVLHWFEEEYMKRCKYKLDMGKSCIRFKRLDDIPYDLIGELAQKITADQWIAKYEATVKK